MLSRSMRSRATRCIVLAAAAIWAAAAVAADSDSGGYRLAGVLAAGSDRVGFLELPQGGQVLVRKGSVINGGTITEFSDKRLRIAFPDHTIELSLDGAGRAMASTTAGSGQSTTAKTVAKSSAHPAGQRTAALPPLAPTPATHTISWATTMQFEVNGIPKAPANADPGRYVADQLAQSFDLPEHSKLLSVNDQPVSSADQAVDTVQQALGRGVAILSLDTPDGPRRVYIAPQRSPGG